MSMDLRVAREASGEGCGSIRRFIDVMIRAALFILLFACGASPRVAGGDATSPDASEPDDDCSSQQLGRSYIGCEYYAVVTANLVSEDFDFAVALSNLGSIASEVVIEGGALDAPRTFEVPAGGVHIEKLPWVRDLKQQAGYVLQSARVAHGAYHVRATHPIVAYQFNALEYQMDGGPLHHEYSFTNDASLLVPVNAMTGSYVVAAWPSMYADRPGELAVAATADATSVTITAKGATAGGDTVAALAPGATTSIMLDRGDVVQLIGAATGDLTGSTISATQPVEVFGAHYCTYIPLDTPACDHLEQSMLPIETLGTTYLVTPPVVPDRPAGNSEVVRIVAAAAGVHLTYDPPLAGAPSSLVAAGDFVELGPRSETFQVSSDGKILVAQYMVGQDAGGGIGDPSLSIAVPQDQYRKSYLFHAPLTYDANYVNITAPLGSSIELDGMPVTGFTPIGGSGYGVQRVLLRADGDGNHRISGDQAFGITVYGYGQYTSYWYPGGLDLRELF
jgi:hypothetical protein